MASLNLVFEPGDIVVLASGSPDLTVVDVCDCGNVEVAYADSDGDIVFETFPGICLDLAPEPDAPTVH